MNMNKGLFVVVEGRDGVGKTVMVEVIMEYLMNGLELNVMGTKEPGSPYVLGNDLIRAMIFGKGPSFDNVSQGLLFFIDHYRHAIWVKERIENGVSVVSDRWLYSQYAYQEVKEERQIDGNLLYRKYEDLQIKPDLVFILDCSGETTKERLQGRTGKDVSQKDKAWGDHERNDAIMREQYRNLYNEYREKQKEVFWVGQYVAGSPKKFFEESVRPEIDSWFEERKEIEEVISNLLLIEQVNVDINHVKVSWIAMPVEVDLRNGNVLCDMAVGACACGASHSLEETVGRIRKLI